MPHGLTESGAFSLVCMSQYCQIEYLSSDNDVGTQCGS